MGEFGEKDALCIDPQLHGANAAKLAQHFPSNRVAGDAVFSYNGMTTGIFAGFIVGMLLVACIFAYARRSLETSAATWGAKSLCRS